MRSREERRGEGTFSAQLYFAGRKSTSCYVPCQELDGESPGTAQAAAVRCGDLKVLFCTASQNK